MAAALAAQAISNILQQAVAYRSSPYWALNSDHQQSFPQQLSHNLQEQVKPQAPGVTAAACKAIQAREHKASTPYPSTTCSPIHTNLSFFLLSTVRTGTSPKYKAGKRDRACMGETLSHMENKWVKPAIWSRVVQVPWMAQGLHTPG